MNNTEIWKDEYFRGFTKGEYLDMKKAQAELEGKTAWERDITDISIAPLSEPMDAEIRANDPTNTIPKEILLDTCDNAGIMIVYHGKEACLRSCAMASLLTTAGISGLGISRVDKDRLSIGLTAFLTGSREKSQIMTRADKVAAVLSGHYVYMPISELLDICDDLEATFGTAEFINGSVSHELTTAEFRYPDAAPQITAAYRSALTAYGRSHHGTITPVVQFRASDTSGEAAKLITYLRLDGSHMIPLGGAKVVHVAPLEYDANGNRLTCMDKFRQEAASLFAKLEYDITDLLPKMLDTLIAHPGNCFIGLCKYANIPQKWGGKIEEEVRADWPDGSPCTFLDLYEAMTEATALAIQDGFTPYSKRVLDLEEGISKVARNRASWKKYDLPGTVAWSSPKPFAP